MDNITSVIWLFPSFLISAQLTLSSITAMQLQLDWPFSSWEMAISWSNLKPSHMLCCLPVSLQLLTLITKTWFFYLLREVFLDHSLKHINQCPYSLTLYFLSTLGLTGSFTYIEVATFSKKRKHPWKQYHGRFLVITTFHNVILFSVFMPLLLPIVPVTQASGFCLLGGLCLV